MTTGIHQAAQVRSEAGLTLEAREEFAPESAGDCRRLRPNAPKKSAQPGSAPSAAAHAGHKRSFGLASVDAVQHHSQADSSLNESFLKAAVVVVAILVAQVFKVGGRVDSGHPQCLGFVGPIQIAA